MKLKVKCDNLANPFDELLNNVKKLQDVIHDKKVEMLNNDGNYPSKESFRNSLAPINKQMKQVFSSKERIQNKINLLSVGVIR